MSFIVVLILIDILGTDKKGKACALSDVFVCHVNKGSPAFFFINFTQARVTSEEGT